LKLPTAQQAVRCRLTRRTGCTEYEWGTIATNYSILAEKAWQVSQHYMMLARELLMEEIRVNGSSSFRPMMFAGGVRDHGRDELRVYPADPWRHSMAMSAARICGR
jgi:hypothetical protein